MLFWIEGICVIVIAAIGLGVNIFAIWRLSCGLRNAEKHCFHKLLLSLSICDLIHLILTVVCFSLPQISERYKNEIYLYLIPYFIPLAQMSLCSSTLTTVALTIERYISLCNPFFRYRFNVKAWHFMATVITFSICYNLPRFFEFKTNSILETKSCYVGPDAGEQPTSAEDEKDYDGLLMDNMDKLDYETLLRIATSSDEMYDTTNSSEILLSNMETSSKFGDFMDPNCTMQSWNITIEHSALRKNPIYVMIYINWMNFIVNLMFPLATLLTLNIKIYQGLQKLRKPYPSPRPTTKSLNSPQEIPKERASLIRTPIFRKSENRQNLSSNMTSMTEDEEQRDRDTRFTRASILMVLAFGLCHTPRLISNILEMFYGYETPWWFTIWIAVSHLLVTINSSFNFLIYLMGSKKRCKSTTSLEMTYHSMVDNRKSSSCGNNKPRLNITTNKPSLFTTFSTETFSSTEGQSGQSVGGLVQIELRVIDHQNNPAAVACRKADSSIDSV